MNNENSHNLSKTGERVIESEYKKNKNEYFIYLCHIATYNYVIPFIKDKKVLEFGCGSGYGSHIISNECKHITAVDISEDAISYAKQNYKNENLEFQQIHNIEHSKMNFENNSFDVVISFQVIEHISDSMAYINELYRVLKNKGIIIIVTPDRVSRLFSFQKPWNMFHVKEFDMTGLSRLVSKRFNVLNTHFMTARKDLIAMEMKRTKRLRLLMLPFTLFFIPEKIRILFIAFAKKIMSKKKQEQQVDNYDFSTKDISISENPKNSINLFIVAEKNMD